MKQNIDLVSVSVKMAMIIFIIDIVMLFIVETNSAEFFILIFSSILMAILIIIGIIKIRLNKNNL